MNGARWRPLLLTLAFWLWWAVIHFPRILGDKETGIPPDFGIYQVFGCSVYTAAAIGLYPGRVCRALTRFEPPQTAIVVLIVASLALQVQGDSQAVLTGIGYTLILLVTVAALSVLWTLDVGSRAICFAGAAVLICLFGLSAIAVHGLPDGRYVGGIHPNTFGSSMLSGFVLSQFRTGLPMIAVRTACVLMAALVSSRFSLVGCVIALVACELIVKPVSPKLVLLAVFGVVLFALFGHEIVGVLALDDPARNLDSGISGRDEYWARAFGMIADNPLGIGFKRANTEDAGHNGYLKMYIELGIFGGTAIVCALLAAGIFAVARAIRVPMSEPRLRRMAAARAAGILAYTLGTFFEPQMFNFGDTHGVMFMLLLFVPVHGFVDAPDKAQVAVGTAQEMPMRRLAGRGSGRGLSG